MNEPKDFQLETAKHVVDLFKKGQKRVLLSDEVGLGKTTVAKTVVDMVRDWHREGVEDEYGIKHPDDYFKVVYICSNINIARQNVGELGIASKDRFDIADSRLSMLHYKIYRVQLEREAEFKEGTMPEQIIPLTPATSFQLKNGQGMYKERALISCLISKLDNFSSKDIRKKLFKKFQINCGDNTWQSCVNYYKEQLEDYYPEYTSDIVRKLSSKISKTLCDELLSAISQEEKNNNIIIPILNKIRHIFAEISIDMLDPDLVIMDEFQRFKDLIHSDSDEEQLLANKFFNSPTTKVLLLSATPYKPYSTLEELNTEGEDQHYKDFMELMKFLFNEKDFIQFQNCWNLYKQALLNGSKEDLFQQKGKAEEMLYRVMTRTERFNSGIIKENIKELQIQSEDVASYIEAQELLNKIAEGKSLPIEYVKSAPYILSFMDKYKLKTDYFEKKRKIILSLPQKQSLLIPFRCIKKYQNIPYNTNSRLRSLYEMVFGSSTQKSKGINGAELLLWVPASRPYYKVDDKCVFAQQKHFSKILIFSAWEMVPRMISILMSYYAEQLTIGKIKRGATERVPTYFNTNDEEDGTNKRLKGYGVSRLTQTGGSLLKNVCIYLANLYDANKYLNWNITDVKKDIKNQLVSKFSTDEKLKKIKKSTNSSAENIEKVFALLDKNPDAEIPENIPEDAFDTLTEIAIASPAICAYRCLKHLCDEEERIAKATILANTIITLFNRSIGAAIIDIIYGRRQEYYVNVLHYCVMGNLQSVLDEFLYMSGDNFFENMTICGKHKSSQLKIDTRESFITGKIQDKSSMRTHFAISFTADAKSEDGVDRVTSIRKTFNSPFRPFILTTTSVGQEGLDFHWYSRKIIHWNLPSNPVDLEQREGRINRYNCLAIRRNVAAMFGSINTNTSWKELFESAQKTLNKEKKYSEIVPHWCLPPQWQDSIVNEEDREMIERIVPRYPFSRDKISYDRLIKVLSLYRLTLGQPRQEELLKLLESYDLTKEEQEKLLFDLSPYNKVN